MPLGQEWVADVRLVSLSGREFAVTRVEVDDERVRIEAAEPGEPHYTVRYRADAGESVSAKATFALRMGDGTEEAVEVSVRARVLGAETAGGQAASPVVAEVR